GRMHPCGCTTSTASLYTGTTSTCSKRSERSVVSIVGTRFFVLSNGSGMVAWPFLARHCFAPAGLVVTSHSFSNRFLKNRLLHFVGVCVQVTSGPPVMASAPIPVPYLHFHPRPW